MGPLQGLDGVEFANLAANLGNLQIAMENLAANRRMLEDAARSDAEIVALLTEIRDLLKGGTDR